MVLVLAVARTVTSPHIYVAWDEPPMIEVERTRKERLISPRFERVRALTHITVAGVR